MGMVQVEYQTIDQVLEVMHSQKYYFDVWVSPVLATTLLFPTIWFVGFGGTSYALGTVAASLFALTIWVLITISQTRRVVLANMHVDRVLLISMGALAFQSLVSYSMAEQFQLVRFGGSIGFLLSMLAGAYCISAFIDGASETVVRRTLYGFAGTLVFMAVAYASGWTLVTDTRFHEPIFIFAEPSHFALVLAPFFLWVVVMCRGVMCRSIALALALVLLLLLKNLTFFVLVGLVSLIVLRAWPLFLMACCLFLVIVGNLDYFIPRMQLTATSSNLSALVWLQGWEEALLGLRETMGVGLGFQQLGINGAKGSISHNIAELLRTGYGTENGALNLLDGGTLGAKLVGEFGVLGIVLVSGCLYLIFGGIRKLRGIAGGSLVSSATVFFYCGLASFSLDLFVRGTGYFSPSVLLFLTGVFGLWQKGRLGIRTLFMNQGMDTK